MAMTVAYWSKALSVDTDRVVQSNREKLMKQELELHDRDEAQGPHLRRRDSP
jgi:hypothetical protein